MYAQPGRDAPAARWPAAPGYTIATSPGSTFQTLLTSNASKCATEGKKSWTVQYFSDSAPIFLGQISSTPVGFVTAKNSPVAKALSGAVNELIANGDYAKIFAKWGTGGDLITKSVLNPATTF